jgi:nucleotide-binding universal stress UspA family protein
MYKKMLVPLDGSKIGEAVLPFVKELTSRLKLTTTCLHICESKEDQFSLMRSAYIKGVADNLKDQLVEVGQEIDVCSEIKYGDINEEILNHARKSETDLILMATHGRSGVSRWVLGSVALKVLRSADVPVWLVRAGAPVGGDWPKVNVIVALDGSKLAEYVLPYVIGFAKQWGSTSAEVILTSVCQTPVMPSDFSDEMEKVWEGKKRQEVDIARCEIQEYLAGVTERLADTGIKVKSEILMGKVADEIVNYVATTPYSVIAMSTHGRSGIGRWVYGSIAERILVGASSPILLVRPSDAG